MRSKKREIIVALLYFLLLISAYFIGLTFWGPVVSVILFILIYVFSHPSIEI
jgi:hypothetical protein